MHYIRLLSEIQPEWFVWENVPGVFSSGKGEDFKAILEAFIEVGYHCAWRVFDTQYVRVDGFERAIPQRRRRVFVVGNLGNWQSAAKVLFDSESLSRNPPTRGKKGQEITGDVTNCLRSGGDGGIPSSRGENLVAATIDASYFRLYGCDNQHVDAGCPNFIIHGSQDPISNSEIANAIGRNQGQKNCICYASAGFGQKIESDVASTLSTNHDDRVTGNNAALVVSIQGEIIDGRRQNQNGSGISESAFALNTATVHGVAYNRTIRRLTPLECERLMGFPDNHTLIEWKGKPKEQCPDGPRYKACGNSFSVNVIRWLGKRIQMVENKND